MGLIDKLKGRIIDIIGLVDIIGWVAHSRSALAWRLPRYRDEIDERGPS